MGHMALRGTQFILHALGMINSQSGVLQRGPLGLLLYALVRYKLAMMIVFTSSLMHVILLMVSLQEIGQLQYRPYICLSANSSAEIELISFHL